MGHGEETDSSIGTGEGRITGPAGSFPARFESQPPCSDSCPAGVDVKTYVNLISDKRYESKQDQVYGLNRAYLKEISNLEMINRRLSEEEILKRDTEKRK